MIEKVQERVKQIPASVVCGAGLITVGLALVIISLAFHYSLFAIIGTSVMFFSTGIGGWLIGRGTQR